jgi:type II secretory pathway component GspD/PulD (secretin)/tetratricopeptide (TPR) repeat protein
MTVVAVLAAWTLASVPALGQDGPLGRAIQLYEQKSYDEALAELRNIDPRALSRSDHLDHEQYTELAQLAVEGRRQSEADLDRAESAVAYGKFPLAKELLGRVRTNTYAAPATVEAAESLLARVAQTERRNMAPDRSGRGTMQAVGNLDANGHVREGQAAIARGDLDVAQTHFERALDQIPGHPDARRGLDQVRQHRLVEQPMPASDGSVLGDLRQRRAILWQRTVASFRQSQTDIHTLVSENSFKDANQKLLFARETLEAGRQYAEPLELYNSLKAEYDALAESVEQQEAQYNDVKAHELRRDLEQRESIRQVQAEEAKAREIGLLMDQVDQKVEDRDFVGAAKVLRAVMQIDPQNIEAEWLMRELVSRGQRIRQGGIDELKETKTQQMLMEAEEAKIPWFEEVNYPDDWLEKLRTPWRQSPGEFPLDGDGEDFEESFMSRIPEVSFNQAPLGDAIDQLARFGGGMNMVPNWPDLATVGVSRDTPITLALRDVSVKTALEETLDQVVGATNNKEVDYTLRNGLVKIATRDFLDRETVVRVYSVQDIVHPIEHQDDAPEMDLRKATANAYVNARRLSQPMFDREREEPEDKVSKSTETERLVALMRQQIRPYSWKANGGAHCSMSARPDGNIVVTQTAIGHQEIFNLLDQLREDRAVQISIEARFLTVSNNFLEDMGIDLDIVLNNGNAGFDRQAGGSPGSFAIDPSTGGALLLPRNFSRLGFTPTVAGVGGAAIGQGGPGGAGAPILQPFQNVAFVPAPTSSGNNFTPIPIQNNVLDYTNRLQSDVPGSFAGSQLPPALQIAGSFLDNIQVDFLIRATQADSRASTMLAPKLILTNGQQSWIALTNQQNFVSTLQPVVASGAAAQQPITDTIDTGAVLNVQAVASPDRRYVTMNLQPGVGRLIAINEFRFSDAPVSGVGAGGFVQLPVIQRQQVKTTVTVPDGGTLLVGGQKTTTEHEIESGVPVLSKIPILKRLYSSRAIVKDEQVLLILIKPKVLIQEEQEEFAHPTLSSR